MVNTPQASPNPTPADARPSHDWLRAVGATPSRDGPGSDPEARAHDAERRAEQFRREAEQAHRRIEALNRALTSRPGLEQAKGILMGIFGISADDAFQALAWVSQNANVKVATIAEWFLANVREHDFGTTPREEVIHLLAVLANNGYDPASRWPTTITAPPPTEPA